MKNSKICFQNLEAKSEEPDEIPDRQDFEQAPIDNYFVDLQFRDPQYEWKKVNQILDGKMTLFGNISPKDVSQGMLGDQYFLCVLDSLARTPSKIKKFFKSTEYETSGKYCIIICGKEIVVDDYFPVRNNKLQFAKSVDNKLWVILLEKAYAKYYGSYKQIECGHPSQAIKDLEMAQSQNENIKNLTQEKLWELLSSSRQQEYLIFAVSPNADSFDGNDGIVPGHCYSIQDVKQIEGDETFQLVELRNIWGRSNIEGNLLRKSEHFSKLVQQQFNLVTDDPGRFWMSLEDFKEKFLQVTIGLIKPDYIQLSRSFQFNQTEPVTIKLLEITFNKKTNAQIGMTQQCQSVRSGSSLIRLAIGKLHPITKEVLSIIGHCYDSDAYVEGEFEIGVYAIYIEVEWIQNVNRSLRLCFYGDQDDVLIKEFEIRSEDIKLYGENVFEGLIRAQALNKEQKTIQYAKDIKRITGILAGYYYFWYFNKTNNITLHEKLMIRNTKNIEVCHPYDKSDTILVKNRPLSTCLVKLRVTKDGNGAFSCSTSSQYVLIESRSDEDIIKLALLRPDERTKICGKDNDEVIFYKLLFNDGIAFVYENEENKVFQKILNLQTQNLEGINFDSSSNQIYIEVPPKQRKVIQFQKMDVFQGYTYQLGQYEEVGKENSQNKSEV